MRSINTRDSSKYCFMKHLFQLHMHRLCIVKYSQFIFFIMGCSKNKGPSHSPKSNCACNKQVPCHFIHIKPFKNYVRMISFFSHKYTHKEYIIYCEQHTFCRVVSKMEAISYICVSIRIKWISACIEVFVTIFTLRGGW